MTKNEIKAKLDKAGVTYGKKDNRETLAAIWGHALVSMDENGMGGVCPHCGIDHKDNGLSTYEHIMESSPSAAKEMIGEYVCLACMGEWGPNPQPATGLKIEKDRPEQNGVKRPSIGGKCRAIWDALDAYKVETGELPTSKTVKALAEDEGWNPNNASIEFYQWRKFNGITKAPKA